MRILDLMLPSSKVLGFSLCTALLGFSVLTTQGETLAYDQLVQLTDFSENMSSAVVSSENASNDQPLNGLGLIPLLPTSSDKNLWSENLNLDQAQSAINQLAEQVLEEQPQTNALDQLSISAQPQSLEAQDQRIQAPANNAVPVQQSSLQPTQASQGVNLGAIGGTVGGIGGLFAAGGLVKGLSSTTSPDYSQKPHWQDPQVYDDYDKGQRPRAARVGSRFELLDDSGSIVRPQSRAQSNPGPLSQRPTRPRR